MEKNGEEYLKIKNDYLRILRTELLFTPLLVFLPLIVSGLLINDWFSNGFLKSISGYDGELMLAIIILVFNIIFDVPFIRSLIKFNKNKIFYK